MLPEDVTLDQVLSLADKMFGSDAAAPGQVVEPQTAIAMDASMPHFLTPAKAGAGSYGGDEAGQGGGGFQGSGLQGPSAFHTPAASIFSSATPWESTGSRHDHAGAGAATPAPLTGGATPAVARGGWATAAANGNRRMYGAATRGQVRMALAGSPWGALVAGTRRLGTGDDAGFGEEGEEEEGDGSLLARRMNEMASSRIELMTELRQEQARRLQRGSMSASTEITRSGVGLESLHDLLRRARRAQPVLDAPEPTEPGTPHSTMSMPASVSGSVGMAGHATPGMGHSPMTLASHMSSPMTFTPMAHPSTVGPKHAAGGPMTAASTLNSTPAPATAHSSPFATTAAAVPALASDITPGAVTLPPPPPPPSVLLGAPPPPPPPPPGMLCCSVLALYVPQGDGNRQACAESNPNHAVGSWHHFSRLQVSFSLGWWQTVLLWI